MKLGSLCALGGFAPFPVESALRHFPEDFHKPALKAAASEGTNHEPDQGNRFRNARIEVFETRPR